MSSPPSFRNLDRISTLPDSVIFHILTFLPTKQSAATSILSKRWYPLWLSLVTLDFNDKDFPDFATFRHFVFSVMLSRNITLPLHSFSLTCSKSSDFNRHDVKRLIDAVVQRGIQNLNIEICHPISLFNPVKLPPCVLTCSSLTLLKLKRLRIIVSFSSVKLPLLKTLHLDTIDFGLQDSYILRKLLDGSPLLEDLQTRSLVMLPISKVEEFNSLLKLVKANISTCHVPFTWLQNAKFICAELGYKYNYQVPTFHNLTHMEIVFKVNPCGKWKWLAQVLQHCPKLQNLTIHQDSSCGNKTGNEDWVDPPIVPKCLSSQLKKCLLKDYKGRTCEFQFVEFILKNAKVLHTMTISASPVDINIKHQMLMKLSLCPRGSTTCKLSFD